MKYIVCELNDENYSQPVFSVAEDLYQAEMFCCEACWDWADLADDQDPAEHGYELEKFNKVESRENVWRQDITRCDCFYVTEVMAFDETKGDYLCMWHHAYDGVDFDIRFQGTEEECINFMNKEIKEEESDEDSVIFSHEATIDTGVEWEHWEVIKVN